MFDEGESAKNVSHIRKLRKSLGVIERIDGHVEIGKQSFYRSCEGYINERVALRSQKNFQLVHDSSTYLQLGKVREDVFFLDFREPLSPLQALMIALTSFES